MNKDQILKTIEEAQESVRQILQDDLKDNPEAACELFQCDCCGQTKILGGSLLYENYRLCNDCVLIAEVGFALGKIKNIQELMDSMEDKRFEAVYHDIFDNNGDDYAGNNN
jgi:hypothetical protein